MNQLTRYSVCCAKAEKYELRFAFHHHLSHYHEGYSLDVGANNEIDSARQIGDVKINLSNARDYVKRKAPSPAHIYQM